ncbi:glycosyltransferase [Pseudomonas sp. PGPR81]|uniref:glycosyltransferase n=1 Tax=unclassified Pseudomonas TaxID=196821 RepID=UPI000E6ADC42|nr:glycosyltransferase [Pseudomonas sp. PGPR81]
MNDGVPRVLVLLAAYNGRAWITEQIESILQQAGVDIRIAISVDASTDGTETLASEWALRDTRVFCLPYGKRFGGAAPNFFRLLVDTNLEGYDYVAFADQDDIWLPNKLRRAHELLATGEYSAYSSDVLAFWPNGKEQVIRKSQREVAYDYLFEAAGPGCTYVFTSPLANVIKQNIVRHQNRIGDVSLHDWFCYAFARANGYRWYIDDQLHMRYRQHAHNQVGVNTGLSAFNKRLRQVFDGWWLRQASLIAQLIGMENHRFVRSWSTGKRSALFRLALRCGECRRRPRDKIAFAVLCVGLAIKGVNK